MMYYNLEINFQVLYSYNGRIAKNLHLQTV